MKEKWKCIGGSCAACCKLAGYSDILPDEWIREDMSCKYLNDKGLCDIYDSRPEVCVVPNDGNDKLRILSCKALRDMVKLTSSLSEPTASVEDFNKESE